MNRKILMAIAALVAVAVAGVVLYFVAIKEDAPAPLDVSDRPVNTAPLTSGTDGTWTLTADSKARYRATESFVGGLANQEVVGETRKVTGSVVVAGTTVTASGPFSVDMKSIASDKPRRDSQYNGRIMETDTFPTATFELDAPIELESVPADGQRTTVTVTGNLTLKSTTRSERVQLDVKLNGDELAVGATIPVTWSDYGIPSPSLAGIVEVEDKGSIELLLVMKKA